MELIRAIISKNLEEKEPTLNLEEFDRKLLQVACQDFINWAKYALNFASEQTSNFELAREIEQFYEDDPREADLVFGVWAGMWLKKWKARVKLMISDQVCSKNSVGAYEVSNNCVTGKDLLEGLECRGKMIAMIVSVLIRNGEFCGAEVLANELLRREVSKKGNVDLNDKKQLFAVLNGALRIARDLACTVGPLIFVKVGREYFAEVNSSSI